ncbi:Radical SAM domain heme biosynthesis protein [Minicystis rosea]|nr:Radical SAM domain heme biosynthesis protein [Minicystis rosea]
MQGTNGTSATVETGFADFQNEALLSGGEGAAGGKVLSHEDAAHEKRNWVRLSYDCNNHCTFCLDSNAHDGTMRANMDIKVQIIEGRKKGAERLILSGGEPTMHPNFLDFVKLGKRAGYPKVQTVTNGRMFKYPEFLDTAARNGLDEITFSLHGHTAKLHDALVGTPGAFLDETAGLKAALASGRFIINIDIVINKMNIKHLPEMLETFIGWGVKEFDLLHVIPFGNAWTEARHHLFYNLEENLPHLQKAFAYARRPDIHIWLNRFPPPYTEGFEDLIQDPYKLNDEVRGRREEYDKYLSLGRKLDCREPERCQYCYLQNLCDTLDTVIEARKAEEVDVLRFGDKAPITGKLPKAGRARLVGAKLADAERLAQAAEPGEIELELDDYDGLAEQLDADGMIFGKKLVRCYTDRTEEMTRLLAMNAAFEVVVFLTKTTAPAIVALGAPPARLALAQKNYDLVSLAHEHDVDLVAFFASYPHRVRVENVPACLLGRAPTPAPRTLDVQMLGTDARIDMTAYTKRYVADAYYTKAVRCSTCRENASCRGMHVNWVRAHGFAPMSPLPADGPGTTAPGEMAAE